MNLYQNRIYFIYTKKYIRVFKIYNLSEIFHLSIIILIKNEMKDKNYNNKVY